MTSDPSLGEVIEASTTEFVAESRLVHNPPPLGQFVRIVDRESVDEGPDPFATPPPPEGAIYAVVIGAKTASREPGRRAAGYGLTEADLRKEQPQIWHLLATDFTCLTVAHAAAGSIKSHLPPKPPRLHSQIYRCRDFEIAEITNSPAYLRTILSYAACPCPDEVIAASIRIAYRARSADGEFLVRAGRELSVLLRDEYERLAAILRNVE